MDLKVSGVTLLYFYLDLPNFEIKLIESVILFVVTNITCIEKKILERGIYLSDICMVSF